MAGTLTRMKPGSRARTAAALLSALLSALLGGRAAQAQDTLTPDATTWFPGAGSTAVLSFEDQWPYLTDYDYNDVVLEVHWQVHSIGGLVYRALLTVDPVALGGDLSNGLGVQLPSGVSKDGLVVERRLGSGGSPTSDPIYGAWSDLALTGDAAPTVVLSSDLRELFGNESGRLNVGVVGKDDLGGQRLEVEFNWPAGVSLDTAQLPFDLYVFRAQTPSHEIHLPQYQGTAAMNSALFGAAGNAVPPAGTRWFVNDRQIPAALNLMTAAVYPREAVAIDTVFPQILQFATSGGTQAQTFYADAGGSGLRMSKAATRQRPATRAITRTSCSPGANQNGRRVRASSACVFTGCASGYALSGGVCTSPNLDAFTRVDVSFLEATATPWVTMWEIGLFSGSTRLDSGYSVAASAGAASLCNDSNATGSSWCLNVAPPSSFSFIATSGTLPTFTALMLHPWDTRWPSRFRVTGTSPTGAVTTLFDYTGGDAGWAAGTARTFTLVAAGSTQNCSVTGGTGTQTWSGTAWSSCVATACSTGYTLLDGACYPTSGVLAFSHTGANQTFVVPPNVSSLTVNLWGAGGGGGSPSRSEAARGGGGGFATGTLAVTPGETLTVVVGGGGSAAGSGAGGFGGGGAGAGASGGGGGGRSAIRRGSTELITAGGGGGGGYDYAGGAGGGSSGLRNPGDGGGGNGGTQSAGGAAIGSGGYGIGQAGSALQGGNAAYYGGGGGGGYFGGGGAGSISGYGNGGGGGSGYIGGVTAATLTAGSSFTPGNAGHADNAGAGTGGTAAPSAVGAGAHGRVVIRF
jgi:LruC domain-containing protein